MISALPPTGQRYGFNCVWCSSRLEATDSQGGTEGTCPTCGQQIVIPIKDRHGRLIDPRTNQILKPDPHPVHAYAAAGERAPKILRKTDGSQEILCTRCNTHSPITANNCRNCGNPFTIEGTTSDAVSESSGLAAASLILGIISLPTSPCLFIFGPLALVLGGISYYQAQQTGGSKGLATAGIILGALGTLISGWVLIR
jgi:DNA-directed RNA polymerase subunit RPC12/RpoP